MLLLCCTEWCGSSGCRTRRWRSCSRRTRSTGTSNWAAPKRTPYRSTEPRPGTPDPRRYCVLTPLCAEHRYELGKPEKKRFTIWCEDISLSTQKVAWICVISWHTDLPTIFPPIYVKKPRKEVAFYSICSVSGFFFFFVVFILGSMQFTLLCFGSSRITRTV